MRFTSFASVIAACILPMPAIAGHIHCDHKVWSVTAAGFDPLPKAYVAGSEDQSTAFFVNLPAPPPGACPYEISDITRIELTFTFIGTMRWESYLMGNAKSSTDSVPGDVSGSGLGPFSFTSGVAQSILLFPPHDQPGAFELHLPLPVVPKKRDGTFAFLLIGPQTNFTISKASITLEGNHWYIPEPSTYVLMTIGGLCLLGYARRGKVS
jgi:hypothetical protein